MNKKLILNTASITMLFLLTLFLYQGKAEVLLEKESHEDEQVHEEHAYELGYQEEETGKKVALTDEGIELAGITIRKVTMGEIEQVIELPGEIGLYEDKVAHIVPRFPGVAKKVYKHTGDYVKEGDVLAAIESNESLTIYEVKSLISGTIIEKHITTGEYVSEDTTIFIIADLSEVWVNLAVYAKDAPNVHIGQNTIIEIVGSSLETKGKISYISPVYNTKSRSLVARVILPNTKGNWRPGTFVKGRIQLPSSGRCPVVPVEAVQLIGGKPVVFVPESTNEFVAIPVVLGLKDEKYVEIKHGLHSGDKYVAAGSYELKAKITMSTSDSHSGHGH